MPFDPQGWAAKEPLPGWEGRFFSSEKMTFGHYSVRAGASIHSHAHPNEEVWTILDGALEVTIGGETRVASTGCVAIVPPDVTHAAKALTDCRQSSSIVPFGSRSAASLSNDAAAAL